MTRLTRRQFARLTAVAAAASRLPRALAQAASQTAAPLPTIVPGPFKGSRESLAA